MILIQIILFPFHFLLRIVARAFLLVSTLGAALIPPILVIFVLMTFGGEALTKRPFFVPKEIIIVYAFLGVLGMFGVILKLVWRAALSALSEIRKAMSELIKGGWLPHPALDFRKSLAVTWSRNIAALAENVTKAQFRSWQLVITLSMVLILLWLAYLSMAEEYRWRKDVSARLHYPPPHVVVVGADEPVASYFFQKGTVFSLPFLKDGSPRTGDGICLTDYHKAWLTEFRNAILKCSEESEVLLEVVGFASVAPYKGRDIGGGGVSSSSNDLNCEIGNRRAEEVVDFLLADEGTDLACGTGENRRRNDDLRYGRTNQCKRPKTEFEIGPNLNFKISYKPWSVYGQMALNKPADDGRLERGQRRYAAEFLNRSVHLKLDNDACKTERTATKADAAGLDDLVQSLRPNGKRGSSAA